jgi:hypothetical protein
MGGTTRVAATSVRAGAGRLDRAVRIRDGPWIRFRLSPCCFAPTRSSISPPTNTRRVISLLPRICVPPQTRPVSLSIQAISRSSRPVGTVTGWGDLSTTSPAGGGRTSPGSPSRHASCWRELASWPWPLTPARATWPFEIEKFCPATGMRRCSCLAGFDYRGPHRSGGCTVDRTLPGPATEDHGWNRLPVTRRASHRLRDGGANSPRSSHRDHARARPERFLGDTASGSTRHLQLVPCVLS